MPAQIRQVGEFIKGLIEFGEMLGIDRVFQDNVTTQVEEIIKSIEGHETKTSTGMAFSGIDAALTNI